MSESDSRGEVNALILKRDRRKGTCKETHMHSIAAARVYVSVFVNVDSVGDAGVGVCEDASVDERLCNWVDVELVAVAEVRQMVFRDRPRNTQIGKTYIVDGNVLSMPSFPPTTPVSVLQNAR